MEELKEVKFVVDEQYENEKGIFTVLSLKKNDMLIRWENGEELQTTVELQTSIQSRRQWEQLQEEIKAEAAKKGTKSGKTGGHFAGFKPGDFKSSAARTNWRGRARLGGAVTPKIAESEFKFNSWAFSTKSELHWQDADKRKKDADGNGARFFARLDTAGLVYGLWVSRPTDQEAAGSTDWDRFYNWISGEEGQNQLNSLVNEHKLTMHDSKGTAVSAMAVEDTYFEISCKVDKKKAISREKTIAEDMAKLFSALVPLYRAAVRP